MNSYICKELVKQRLLDISLKIRFDFDDGSYKELNGKVEEAKVHFDENKANLDFLISYEKSITPLPYYMTVFIGIKDCRNDNIIWFNQGKFRDVDDCSCDDMENKKLHIIALNDNSKYEECVMLEKKDTLDNEFIQDILIDENKDFDSYDTNTTSCNDLYITTIIFPAANECKEIEYKRMNDNEIRRYEVKEFLHDICNGTTKWHLTKVKERTIKMTKELSIKTIKKELIDRILNTVEVLKYLNTDRVTNNGKDDKLSDVYNTIVFDYDSGNNSGDFIAIEVGEHKDFSMGTNNGYSYTVSIKIGLVQKKDLDRLAAVIKDIISDLYLNAKKYRNIPFYSKSWNGGNDLNRLITFEIEE